MNHDCSTKAVFLCTAVKLQSCHMLPRRGTYWGMLVCSLLHISFMGTVSSVVLSSSCYEVLSFETSPWAGFGQILDVACATTERHSCPVCAYFSIVPLCLSDALNLEFFFSNIFCCFVCTGMPRQGWRPRQTRC